MADYAVISNGIEFFVRTYDSGIVCVTVTPPETDDSVLVMRSVDTETREEEFTIRLPQGIKGKDMHVWAAAVHVASAMMTMSQEEDDGESAQEHGDGV